jgi:hypothetical protein
MYGRHARYDNPLGKAAVPAEQHIQDPYFARALCREERGAEYRVSLMAAYTDGVNGNLAKKQYCDACLKALRDVFTKRGE